MQSMSQLSKTLGVGKRSLHRRVAALGGLISPYVKVGKHGANMVEDEGIAILRRLIDLESSGISIEEASHRIRQELQKGELNGTVEERPSAPTGDPQGHNASFDPALFMQELIKDKAYYKERLLEKDQEIERLLVLLERLQEKIPALPGDSQPASSKGRWFYFRKLITG